MACLIKRALVKTENKNNVYNYTCSWQVRNWWQKRMFQTFERKIRLHQNIIFRFFLRIYRFFCKDKSAVFNILPNCSASNIIQNFFRIHKHIYDIYRNWKIERWSFFQVATFLYGSSLISSNSSQLVSVHSSMPLFIRCLSYFYSSPWGFK